MNDSREYFTKRCEPAAIRALQQWSGHEAHEVAIGLAYAAGGTPGDWRVWTLPWMYSEANEHVPAIAYRLSLVATLAAANAGATATPEVIAAAVGDAMRFVRERRAPASLSERALQLRVRKKTYGVIRGQAEATLRKALSWALRRYLRTCDPYLADLELANFENRKTNETDTLARAA